jgi:hypothetical protein
MSRYVTVGFDRDGDAEKFERLIRGNGLKIRLAEQVVDQETNNKTWRINNIQARSAHEWKPANEWERRRYEYSGVILEFKDQLLATEFTRLLMNFLVGKYKDDQELLDAAYALTSMIDQDYVAGVRLERE